MRTHATSYAVDSQPDCRTFLKDFFLGGAIYTDRSTLAARINTTAPPVEDHLACNFSICVCSSFRSCKQARLIAIVELESKSPPGIKSCVILELALALMVAKGSKWRNVEQFSRQVRPSEVLISLPPEEAITRLFQKGFARNGLNFAAGVEIPSLDSMKAMSQADSE